MFAVVSVCFILQVLASQNLEGLQSHKSINQMQSVCSFGLLPKVIPPLLSSLCGSKVEMRLSSGLKPVGAEKPNTTLRLVCSTFQMIIVTGFLFSRAKLKHLIFIVMCKAAVLDSLPGPSCCPAVEFSFSLSKMCCSGNLTLPEKTDPA